MKSKSRSHFCHRFSFLANLSEIVILSQILNSPAFLHIPRVDWRTKKNSRHSHEGYPAVFIKKYPERESNPHGRNGHRILSPACLPIPPPGPMGVSMVHHYVDRFPPSLEINLLIELFSTC